MSEVQPEPQPEPETQEQDGPEPEPDATPDESEEEEASEEVEGQQGEPEDEPSIEAQRRQQQQAGKRVQSANRAHLKRLQDIFGDEFATLLVCPRCTHEALPFGGTMGLILPPALAPVPDDVKTEVLESIGEQGEVVTKTDPYSRRCDVCDGAGYVLTGSRLNRQRTIRCIPCEGRGWLAVGDERRVAQNAQPAIPPSAEVLAVDNGSPSQPPPQPEADLWGRPKNHPDYGMHPEYVQAR